MSTEPSYLSSNAGVLRLFDNIQATVPGVLLEVLKMELWNTIEEFALRSTFYRAIAPWTMGPYVREFDFNPYEGSMLAFGVLDVTGLCHYLVKPPAVLVDNEAGVTAGRTGFALLALKPVSLDCCLPDDLFNRWFETMMDGVKGRLCAHPSKPYSSTQLAAYHARRFRVGINLARASAQELNSGQSNFRFPYFARGRRKQ